MVGALYSPTRQNQRNYKANWSYIKANLIRKQGIPNIEILGLVEFELINSVFLMVILKLKWDIRISKTLVITRVLEEGNKKYQSNFKNLETHLFTGES